MAARLRDRARARHEHDGPCPSRRVVLTLARSLGEFGAVKIVSGNLEGRTQTATLLVEQKYQDFEQATAYASAFMLAFAAVVCIIIVSILRPKEES